VAYTTYRYLHHHAVHAAYDAAGGNGSITAENDERDDASDDGGAQLEFCLRFVSLLVGGKLHRHRTTGGHESHQLGPRNARDGREESKEEGEVKLSGLLAVSLWLCLKTSRRRVIAKSQKLKSKVWFYAHS
jgi:hypothetical protein